MSDTVNVIGTPCLLTSHRNLTSALEQVCRNRGGSVLSVDFTNVHIVALRSVDEAFRTTTSSVDWFVPDSQVLSWAVSLIGGRGHERVYGPSFLKYFILNADPDLSHYFLGGSQECLDALINNLRNWCPNLKIGGSHNGYFLAEDEDEIIETINRAKPDILWVGLGTPKQQEWIYRHKPVLQAGAILAVGFAFDVNAGTKKDAPSWMGSLGLTWLYRLLSEPRRLWKRYLHFNTVFVVKFVKQIATGSGHRNSRKEIVM